MNIELPSATNAFSKRRTPHGDAYNLQGKSDALNLFTPEGRSVVNVDLLTECFKIYIYIYIHKYYTMYTYILALLFCDCALGVSKDSGSSFRIASGRDSSGVSVSVWGS